MRARFVLLLVTLLLSACGFHLRGMIDTPNWLTDIALNSNGADAELVSMLKSQLSGYKINVNSDPSRSPYWLIINQTNYQQRIVSVGSSTNPRQYQLILTVDFMLQTRKGKIISPYRQIMATRQLTVNNNRILGSNEEEQILLREMRQDALMQMLTILFKANPNRHAN